MYFSDPTDNIHNKTNLINQKYTYQMTNNETTNTCLLLIGLYIWSDEVFCLHNYDMRTGDALDNGWTFMQCFEPTAEIHDEINLRKKKYTPHINKNETTSASTIRTGLYQWSDEFFVYLNLFFVETGDALDTSWYFMYCYDPIENMHHKSNPRNKRFTSQMMKNDTISISILLPGL